MTTEVVEAVSSVLDQVKVVFKWKGTCKLCNSATLASSRTTGERPVTLPSLFWTCAGLTRRTWLGKWTSQHKKPAPQALPGQLTLATAFSGVPRCYERTNKDSKNCRARTCSIFDLWRFTRTLRTFGPSTRQSSLGLLSRLYMKVLCVVVSGSPVQRVFSVAGNIIRPRRSRMNAKLLCALILLKCNFDLM